MHGTASHFDQNNHTNNTTKKEEGSIEDRKEKIDAVLG
jgi:hypothetical protein